MISAIGALRPNGVVCLTGIPAEGKTIEIDAGRYLRDLVLENQVVFGTVNAGHRDYLAAIQQLEQFMFLFPAAVRKLITHRVPLGEASRMLVEWDGIKNVVELGLRAA
jgi:threonine dehydrogenase-like Zn-dependent dehydrogenase